MMEFIIGAALGTGAMFAKNKLVDEKAAEIAKLDMEELSDNLEKEKKRNKDLEARIDDLLAKNSALSKAKKDSADETDDLEDEVEDAKMLNKKIKTENENLKNEILELKKTLAAAEAEIESLKK